MLGAFLHDADAVLGDGEQRHGDQLLVDGERSLRQDGEGLLRQIERDGGPRVQIPSVGGATVASREEQHQGCHQTRLIKNNN